MKTLLKSLFISNWQRKCTAALLAAIIWIMVNQTLTTSKTLTNIPIKIVSVPHGKTVQGLQPTGFLKRRLTVTLVGNKTVLDELTSNDFEIVVDASGMPDEWELSISQKNLHSVNPEIDLQTAVSKIYYQSFPIRLMKLITEQIPIVITKPIGDAPRDYQFLDVWPYRLTLTITGPEDVVKRIKAKEIRLTFNLNDISKAQLDALQSRVNSKEEDVISFFVPEPWKQIHLPLISDAPIEINDPQAKALRIDFVRCDIFALNTPIPVSLFFPSKYLSILNPSTCSLAANAFVEKKEGASLVAAPLFAKGVSHLFLQTVKEMLQISIIAVPKSEKNELDWSVEFINPRHLEDQYVSSLLSEASEEDLRTLQPHLREDYLRNRFRNYMNRFQLYKADETKLELNAELKNGLVEVTEEAHG